MAQHLTVSVLLILVCCTLFYEANANVIDDSLGSYGNPAGRPGGYKNQRQLMIPFPRVGRSFSSLQVPGKRQRVKGIPLPRVGKRDNEEFDQVPGKSSVVFNALQNNESEESLQPLYFYIPLNRQNDFGLRK